MKNTTVLFITLLAMVAVKHLTIGNAFAAENVTSEVIYTDEKVKNYKEGKKIDSGASVIRIVDEKFNNVCYIIKGYSDIDRSSQTGYPGLGISCMPMTSKKVKK